MRSARCETAIVKPKGIQSLWLRVKCEVRKNKKIVDCDGFITAKRLFLASETPYNQKISKINTVYCTYLDYIEEITLVWGCAYIRELFRTIKNRTEITNYGCRRIFNYGKIISSCWTRRHRSTIQCTAIDLSPSVYKHLQEKQEWYVTHLLFVNRRHNAQYYPKIE